MIELAIICGLLVAALIAQQQLHSRTVDKLCDRIQAPEVAPRVFEKAPHFTPTLVDDEELARRENE